MTPILILVSILFTFIIIAHLLVCLDYKKQLRKNKELNDIFDSL